MNFSIKIVFVFIRLCFIVNKAFVKFSSKLQKMDTLVIYDT